MPIVDGDGFSHEPGVLQQVTGQVNQAADQLHSGLEGAPEFVDAGISSDVAGKALADLVRLAAKSAGQLQTIASGVDAARGTYTNVENTNTGWLQANENRIERAKDRIREGNPGTYAASRVDGGPKW